MVVGFGLCPFGFLWNMFHVKFFAGYGHHSLSECGTLLSLIYIVKLDHMENSYQILLELINYFWCLVLKGIVRLVG